MHKKVLENVVVVNFPGKRHNLSAMQVLVHLLEGSLLLAVLQKQTRKRGVLCGLTIYDASSV